MERTQNQAESATAGRVAHQKNNILSYRYVYLPGGVSSGEAEAVE